MKRLIKKLSTQKVLENSFFAVDLSLVKDSLIIITVLQCCVVF